MYIDGGGTTGKLFRSIDWAQHPLGPVENWPSALKVALNILFLSKHPMFIWWGPELYQFYNDSYLPSFGVGKHPTAMGQRGEDCWPEIWPAIKPQIDHVMTERGATWNENQLLPIFRNGRLEDVYWTYGYSPILNEDGSVGGTLVICTETTDSVTSARKIAAARDELQRTAEKSDKERAKFEAAFQAVAEGIFIFDSLGEPVFMNDAAAKTFGSKSAADLMERVEYYFERLELREMNGDLVPIEEWPIARALSGESFRNWHLNAHRKDTGDHWVWSSSGELARQAGTDVTLGVVVLRDITPEYKVAQDLKKAKLEAETANSAKSSFLANMSHEIRTPLGAILGFTDLIRTSNSFNERAEYADIISRNGKALTKIIDDILDLSKVEAGRLQLETLPFEVHGLLHEMRDLFSDTAAKKGISLQVSVDPDLQRKVKSDPTRIRQILVNLIGNAVKFTSGGSVKVHASPIFAGDKLAKIQFTVADTGVGISAAQSQRLFEPFSQADNSTTRKFGGSGLGLALSRRLAQALGGDVYVERSIPGEGSVFVAVVEAADALLTQDAPEPASSAHSRLDLQGLRALLVEDSPDNQTLLKHILSKHGVEVEVADNGALALTKISKAEFDIVLMDMQMPVLDGYAATSQLRKMGYRKPIIALTAHAMEEERKRTLEAGCDTHLTKPLDVELLLLKIANLARKPPAAPTLH